MVDHKILFEKMTELNIGRRVTNLLPKLYEKTEMRVKVGDEISTSFRLERGVRQGFLLSPMLFNIFINDILDDIKVISFPGVKEGPAWICYADGTLIFAESKNDMQLKIEAIEA